MLIKMKHSLMFLIFTLFRLSHGLPCANSEYDSSSLDAATSSQGQPLGQYAEGSHIVDRVKAAINGQQAAGQAQAVAEDAVRGAQVKFLGQAGRGSALSEFPVQADGPSQPPIGEPMVGGAQADRSAHPQLSRSNAGATQAAEKAQSAERVMQAAGGAQAKTSGPTDSGDLVGRVQVPAGGTEAARGVQAAGGGQPIEGAKTLIEGPIDSGTKVEKIQVAAKGTETIRNAQAAVAGGLIQTPGLKQSQGGMQINKNQPSSNQTSKDNQAQWNGGIISSNLPANVSGSALEGSELSDRQINANARAEVGFEIAE